MGRSEFDYRAARAAWNSGKKVGTKRPLKPRQSSRAVQILLGHTKIENTVRYLGVDGEDALTLAEGIEI